MGVELFVRLSDLRLDSNHHHHLSISAIVDACHTFLFFSMNVVAGHADPGSGTLSMSDIYLIGSTSFSLHQLISHCL